MSSDKPKMWSNPFHMSYEEAFKWQFNELIALFRETEKDYGYQKAVELGRRTREGIIKKEIQALKKRFGEVNCLEDFLVISRFLRDTPIYRNARTVTDIVETSEEYSYKVTSCLWAKTFRELEASDLGVDVCCHSAYCMAREYSPKLVFTRTQTIMEGAPHCDYRYTWEE